MIEFWAEDPGWFNAEGYRMDGAEMTWTIQGPGLDEIIYGPGPMGSIEGTVSGLSDGETYALTYDEYVAGEGNFESITCEVTAEGVSTDLIDWNISVGNSYERPDETVPPPDTQDPWCASAPWLCDGSGSGWVNPTEMRIAVIPIQFRGDSRIPGSARALGDKYFNTPDTDGIDRSLARFLHEASYGQVSVTGEVFPVVRINSKRGGCEDYSNYTIPYRADYYYWALDAHDQLEASGVDLSSFTHIEYVWPRTDCSFAGKGAMPGEYSWINMGPQGWANPALSDTQDPLTVVIHEIGHNLGLNHAGVARCSFNGRRVSLGGTCARGSTVLTGHPFLVMGYPRKNRLLTAYERFIAGFLNEDQYPQYAESGEIEVTLNPVEFSDSVIKGARIVRQLTGPREYRQVTRPSNGRELCVEWHRPLGIFNTMKGSAKIMNGLMVNVCDERPLLVDAHPKTSTLMDAALKVGETLVDQFSGIQVTVLSMQINKADPARSEMRVRILIP